MGCISFNRTSLLIQGIILFREHHQSFRNVVILLFIFALMSPIGIGIGWAISTQSAGLTGIIFNALSAGTLLFIGAYEVPELEFAGEKDSIRLLKYVMYCVGFVVILVMDVILKNSVGGHSH